MAIKTIKVEKFFRKTENKEGKPYKDKNGKPFTMCSVLTKNAKGEDTWMSCLDYKDTIQFQEGQTFQLDVTKNGEYLNFRIPTQTQLDVMDLRERVEALEKAQTTTQAPKAPESEAEQAVDDFDEWANTPVKHDDLPL